MTPSPAIRNHEPWTSGDADDARETDAHGIVAALVRFAANPSYRSATVQELTIDDDFCRRPLRPEDLPGIDFSIPLDLSSLCTLRSLAANRMLLSVYESGQVVPGALVRDDRRTAVEAYHGDANRGLGERIRPFLERLVFGALEAEVAGEDAPDDGGVEAALRACRERDAILHRASAGDAARAKLRLLQNLGLASSTLVAVRTGYARAGVEPAAEAVVGQAVRQLEAVAGPRVLEAHGLSSARHAHWQFYLPTTLACANFLHRLAADPRRWFEFEGAAAHFVVETVAALAGRIERGEVELDRLAALEWPPSIEALGATLRSRPAEARRRWQRGFRGAQRLREARDRDLWAQLAWLSALPQHGELAHALEANIHRERLAIDRETFIEPREMCSTTHVHDEHRLVVVEDGHMVFWGAPGMRLDLTQGQAMLVPRGRLHGSTVESARCTYHQPIIPDAWVTSVQREPPWT